MTIKQARAKMAKELRESEFRRTYMANITCLLYDNRESLKTIDGVNRMAERLLKLIFE